MLLRKASNIFDRFLDVLMYAACILLILAMFIVAYEVTARYGFNISVGWAIEITELILVGIVSLGMTWLLREEGHIKVDFLLNRLNPKYQALVIGLTSALGAVAFWIIFFYGLRESINLMQAGARETGVLRLPKHYWLFPLVFGSFLFLIQLLRRSCKHLREWNTNYDKNKKTLHSIEGGRQPWNGI